jgi:hypothetical protein
MGENFSSSFVSYVPRFLSSGVREHPYFIDQDCTISDAKKIECKQKVVEGIVLNCHPIQRVYIEVILPTEG